MNNHTKNNNNTNTKHTNSVNYDVTYQQLEEEIKERHAELTATSWRGDLTKRGLQSISWGDLNNLK